MKSNQDWTRFWLETARRSNSDFEYNHGRSPGGTELEDLSTQELLTFIDAKSSEIIFDAGCGTGANILLLHRRAQALIGMDYNRGAIERSQKHIIERKLANVQLLHGSITEIPLPDSSVDKVICLSVLQYLDNGELRKVFSEFARILTRSGVVILHVKNISSIYLSTLWAIKKLRSMFRHATKLEYLRSYRWYVAQLTAAGFEVLDYNSFNWFVIEGMPNWLLSALRRFEFRHYRKPLFRTGFIRRHGADLKIKAQKKRISALV